LHSPIATYDITCKEAPSARFSSRHAFPNKIEGEAAAAAAPEDDMKKGERYGFIYFRWMNDLIVTDF